MDAGNEFSFQLGERKRTQMQDGYKEKYRAACDENKKQNLCRGYFNSHIVLHIETGRLASPPLTRCLRLVTSSPDAASVGVAPLLPQRLVVDQIRIGTSAARARAGIVRLRPPCVLAVTGAVVGAVTDRRPPYGLIVALGPVCENPLVLLLREADGRASWQLVFLAPRLDLPAILRGRGRDSNKPKKQSKKRRDQPAHVRVLLWLARTFRGVPLANKHIFLLLSSRNRITRMERAARVYASPPNFLLGSPAAAAREMPAEPLMESRRTLGTRPSMRVGNRMMTARRDMHIARFSSPRRRRYCLTSSEIPPCSLFLSSVRIPIDARYMARRAANPL